MNNPSKRTLLCYGDSNTYGVKSDRSGRYGENERWPAVLQAKLGEEWKIIEEGLPGRTTDLDHPNPDKPGRNGWATFQEVMRRSAPIDTLILMLGTNDLKTSYKRSPQEVAEALEKYVSFTREYNAEQHLPAPRVILISPPYINDAAPEFESSMPTPGIYDAGSASKSDELGEAIANLATVNGCEFFDAATVARPGVDGIHMDVKSHIALAETLAQLLSE